MFDSQYLNFITLSLVIFGLPLAYCIYWTLYIDELRYVPGPYLARYGSFWLAVQCRLGRRSIAIHRLHQQYGDFVRITQNHVSISQLDAKHQIYTHDRAYRKGTWYQPYKLPHPPLLATFDADEHREQRRNMNPAFSARALREFEPQMSKYYRLFRQRLMTAYTESPKSAIDLNKWVNFLAFDLIGHFSFGNSFAFLESGSDSRGMLESVDARLKGAAAVGVLPAWLQPYMPYMPFDKFWRANTDGLWAVRNFVTEAYKARLQTGDPDAKDMLSYLLEAKSEHGNSLPEPRIISQLHSLVIAGSDSTASSTIAFIDQVSRDATLQRRVQAEIDEVFPGEPDVDWVPTDAEISRLTYMKAALYEVLRLRPTAAMGFERWVTEQSLVIGGFAIPVGNAVSVPIYSMHRSPEAFPDPDSFIPERWLAADTTLQHQYFGIFSHGPRNCIGQNFALMEMTKTITFLLKLFDFERGTTEETKLHESFFIRPQDTSFLIKPRY